MQLRVGDRFTDETGEWEIISQPYTTGGGKIVHARVRKVGEPAVDRGAELERAPEGSHTTGVKPANADPSQAPGPSVIPPGAKPTAASQKYSRMLRLSTGPQAFQKEPRYGARPRE